MRLSFQTGVSCRHVNDELLIYDARNEQVYCFNSTGAYIIEKLCCQGETFDSLLETIKSDYTTGTEQIEQDVISFVDQLLQKELVQNAP